MQIFKRLRRLKVLKDKGYSFATAWRIAKFEANRDKTGSIDLAGLKFNKKEKN